MYRIGRSSLALLGMTLFCNKTPSSKKRLFFHTGVCYIPHPGKRVRGGEDSSYVSSHTLAVFDGVSAWWYEDGIDAGNYAFGLAEATKQNDCVDITSQKLLERAFASVNLPGSSTACIVRLCQNGELDTTHIGDTGYGLFRNDKFISIFEPQCDDECEEDRPYQLGREAFSNKPCDAVRKNVTCKVNDIVIVASDGFWDNMDNEKIERTIMKWKSYCPNGVMPHKLAWILGDKAIRTGSKNDDITIVVAQILDEDLHWTDNKIQLPFLPEKLRRFVDTSE